MFFGKGWKWNKIIFVQITNLYLKANYAFYISLFLRYETIISPISVFAISAVVTI